MQALECHEALELLAAFEANELEALASLAVQKHLDACDACRGQWHWEREVSGSLRRLADAAPTPASELRDRLLTFSSGERARSTSHPRRRTAGWFWKLAAAAACLALTATGWTWRRHRHQVDNTMRPFVADYHATLDRGATQGQSAVELQTDDPGEAAAWLQSRLTFAVRLPVEQPRGFRLLGARLCRVEAEPMGFLLYEQTPSQAGEKSARLVSCFVRGQRGQSESANEPRAVCGSCDGTHFVAFDGDGLSYVLVSELPEKTLLAFAR